ncbi:rhodanese-like domain-containing protein (plasmid) [Deinococcus psychrotolerans]|uniref:Rhodanese-like domain-containing protein n=1 Tax=Deinococcus psychrotolerans TaxID=2489213 RepID=A0A3G8YTD4_9DEIO|nr:rhodanese-like domain-containing protein [Deinococcus psychrotolerans]AZI44961.1 rhodanese-like domain-containing protein [Deinococcus psychrotolerans]
MLTWFKKLLGSGAETHHVSAAEAQLLVQGGALLVDVRSKAERQILLIPGSKHLPLEQVGHPPASFASDRVIICQCASGHRSGLAARQLRAQGFDARSLSGGITAWKNAGFPVKKG